MTSTPNLGFDLGLDNHWSAALSFGYNGFDFPNHRDNRGIEINPKIHHWLISAEAKYSFTDRSVGHFLSAQIFGGRYNAGGISFPRFLKDSRYEGYGIGASVNYGYRFRLSEQWSLELAAGPAYIHLDYDKYRCGRCGARVKSGVKNMVLPRGALNIIYLLPSKRKSRERKIETTSLARLEQTSSDSRSKSLLDTIRPDTLHSLPSTFPDLRKENVKCQQKCDTMKWVITYPVDKSDLQKNFDSNADGLASLDSVLINTDPQRIIRIKIIGYASPEYGSDYNKSLSERRALEISRLIRNQYGLEAVVLGEGEDWRGLRDLMSKSPLSSKGEMRAFEIVSADLSPTQRKKKLFEIDGGITYGKLLKMLFPKLRRTEIEIIIDDTEKSESYSKSD